ncbi:MAG TPA: hypothetical protein VFI22_15835 [Thermomicrobiales bacterium]|nr:hypothetical protein [Thermomicrobiales bacterium]
MKPAAGLSRRDAARLGAAVAAAAILIALPASALQRRTWAAPRLILLGSGGSLSALATAGEARAIVAAGDDPVAFGNALARIQPWSARRIDLLLAAGAGQDLLVPAALAADSHARWVGVIGDPPRGLPDPLAGAHRFDDPRVIHLPLGLDLLVEQAPAKSGPPPWRVTVTRGRSRIAIVSDGSAPGELPAAAAPDALVVAGADPLLALEAAPAAALFAAADAVSGADLRVAAASMSGPLWTRRVFPGEAVGLAFSDRGLDLPATGMLRLTPATPAPDRDDDL